MDEVSSYLKKAGAVYQPLLGLSLNGELHGVAVDSLWTMRFYDAASYYFVGINPFAGRRP